MFVEARRLHINVLYVRVIGSVGRSHISRSRLVSRGALLLYRITLIIILSYLVIYIPETSTFRCTSCHTEPLRLGRDGIRVRWSISLVVVVWHGGTPSIQLLLAGLVTLKTRVAARRSAMFRAHICVRYCSTSWSWSHS